MVGLELGSYKLVTKIGEGGMGEVYIAEHSLLRRKVAVKLLLKEFCGEESIVKRFLNEARATSQIAHPGIVQIFDFGKTPDGSTYMIMELLEGETLLAAARKRGRLPIPEAIAIVRQMAEALNAAHALQVVHRDLKPENVFLVPDAAAPFGQRVKILDFGIAKMLDPSVSAPHTKTGSVLGTPIYMSPEQCLAAPKIDQRADLYSLGCVFFHLLCGRPPFDLVGIGELLGAHVYTPPPVPSTITAAISPSLDAVVLKLLQKKPDDRYASMVDFIAALDQVPALSSEAAARAAAAPIEVPVQRSGSEAATIVAVGRSSNTPRPIEPPSVPAIEPRPAAPAPEPLRTEPQPRKEITTLGGSAGEKTRNPAIPQPEARRSSSLVAMLIAFGLTVSLALGAFFLFGHHGAVSGGSGPSLVTLTIDSDPPGAEVYRDGVLLGVTPYQLKQLSAAGEAALVIKKAGFEDAKVALASDHDGSQRVTLQHTNGAPH
jgi:serine/threonine protein kinase